jgi:hypothetical protein
VGVTAPSANMVDPEDNQVPPPAVPFQQFRTWLVEEGVTDPNIGSLIDSGFNSHKLLSLMITEDIEDLQVQPRAQYRLLTTLVAESKAERERGQAATIAPLPNPVPAPVVHEPVQQHAPTGAPVPGGGGALLDTLLRELPLPASILGPPTITNGPAVRPDLDLTLHLSSASLQPGNALHIIDFVNIAGSCEVNVEHVLSDVGGGSSFLLNSGPKKLRLENLSCWQWSLGSRRIQDHLERTGKLLGDEARRQYSSYCCRVLEMNARFDWQSILLYDRDYRVYQAAYGFPWGTNISHLNMMFLREKNRFTQAPSQNRPGSRQQQPKAPGGGG